MRHFFCALALLLALAGCDSNDTDSNAFGSFEATVVGDTRLELEGDAGFATETEDGQTVTAVGLIDENDPQDVIILAMPGQPRTGTFRVDSEQAGGLFTLTNGSEGALYFFRSGQVVISRSTSRALAGRFNVEAVSIMDLNDIVTIEGTFDAEPGEVETDKAHFGSDVD